MSIDPKSHNFETTPLLHTSSSSDAEAVEEHIAPMPPHNPHQSKTITNIAQNPLKAEAEAAKSVTQGTVPHLKEGQATTKPPKQGMVNQLKNWYSNKFGTGSKLEKNKKLLANLQSMDTTMNLRTILNLNDRAQSESKLRSHFQSFRELTEASLNLSNPNMAYADYFKTVNTKILGEAKRLQDEVFGGESNKSKKEGNDTIMAMALYSQIRTNL